MSSTSSAVFALRLAKLGVTFSTSFSGVISLAFNSVLILLVTYVRVVKLLCWTWVVEFWLECKSIS